MKLFQALFAVLIGSGALAMGCAEEADDLDTPDDPALAPPARTPLGGPAGSTGTNSLPPPDFGSNRGNLYTSTQSPFATYVATDDEWWIANNTANNALLSTSGGRKVIKYAARCALPTTVAVNAQVGSTVFSYPGKGLLTTTQEWLTVPLALTAAQDLFTCMLAHLNAFGVEVPINLSGPSVTNTTGDDASFTWEEALWAAKIIPGTSKTTFNFHVWPLDDLVLCESYVEQLTNRVCGGFSGNCGLTVRSDRATACTETSTGWYCDVTPTTTLPAIKTRLKVTDVESLYDCP